MKKPLSFYTLLSITCLFMSSNVQAASGYSNYLEISCRDFIQQTIQNDPQFKHDLQTYLKVKYRKLSVSAIAAWTFTAQAGIVYNESISGSFMEPDKVDAAAYNISLQKLFPGSGTSVRLSHDNTLSELEFVESGNANMFADMFQQSEETSTPSFTLQIIQPLLKNSFGLADRYPLESAALQKQAAWLDVQEAWENRLQALLTIYLDWVDAYENMSAMEEIMKELKQLENLVQRKVKTGMAERADWLKTKDNILRSEKQLLQATMNFKNMGMQINVLRQAPETILPALPKIKPQFINNNAGFSTSALNTANLRISQLRIIEKLNLIERQLIKKNTIAKNARLPQLDIIGSLSLKGQTGNLRGGYDDINENDYSVFLKAGYPLGPKANADVLIIASEQEEINQSLRAAKQTLSLGLLQTGENIRDLDLMLEVMQQQYTFAEEKMNIDRSNYKMGRLDTYYLIDSRNSLTTIRLQLIQSRIHLSKLKLSYMAIRDLLLPQYPDLCQKLLP
ncbi:TolC family protein [bacterium]|nr:TolC family protein [bacterium]